MIHWEFSKTHFGLSLKLAFLFVSFLSSFSEAPLFHVYVIYIAGTTKTISFPVANGLT